MACKQRVGVCSHVPCQQIPLIISIISLSVYFLPVFSYNTDCDPTRPSVCLCESECVCVRVCVCVYCVHVRACMCV